MFFFALGKVNYRVLNHLFSRGILTCPDTEKKEECLKEMSEEILICQVSAGLALSFALIVVLTRVIEIAKFSGIMFGGVVGGYLLLTQFGRPSVVRLREIVGKGWPKWFALVFAVFSTVAAFLVP